MSAAETLKRILIVDDDVAVTNYLMVFLVQTGLFETLVINDSRQVADAVADSAFDLVLLDMDMPHLNGMEVLRELKRSSPGLQAIILTGVSDVDLAVKAMKLGAFDYLTKPVDDEHLLEVIDAALEHRALHESISSLPQAPSHDDLENKAAFDRLPTQDSEMIRRFHQAERIAASDLGVFIWGERGTGKEALARAIHKVSPRHAGPFVAINAAGQDQASFPAALFGQARSYSGAKEESPGFFEEARGGTIYIDEVEALSRPVQVRLKRVIQAGEYYRESSTQIIEADVRIIVASDRDPAAADFKETFSDDLLYHLMINSIQMPPLRDRSDDIPLLAEFFLKREEAKIGRTFKGLNAELLALLTGYDFPDNLQELKTLIACAVANEEGEELTVEALPPYIMDRISSGERAERRGFVPRTMVDMQRDHAARMLEYYGNDHARTARELNIPIDDLEGLLG